MDQTSRLLNHRGSDVPMETGQRVSTNAGRRVTWIHNVAQGRTSSG